MTGPAGNYYDKFNTGNPIARWLMTGFIREFGELFAQVDASSILEIGCGEGHMLSIMHNLTDAPLSGFDVDMAVLKAAKAICPDARIILADGHHLPYADKRFDLVVTCEVLEHVQAPDQVMREMKRVGRKYCITSVPREPLWRMLNMIRGKYWRDLGNTPGHIQHWSARSYVGFLGQHFEVIAVRNPLPWTMALCRIPE